MRVFFMPKINSFRLPLELLPTTKVGVFIDEANLFYLQKTVGWKIDWRKFASLWKTSCKLKALRYYIGMPPSGKARLKNTKLKKYLESHGYTVITKPLKKIFTDNKKSSFKYKCNFDVEIALDVASLADELDLVVIVSGDSDFIAVRDTMLAKKKKVFFVCFERRVAWEIRRSKHLFLESLKPKIELQQKTPTKGRGGVTR